MGVLGGYWYIWSPEGKCVRTSAGRGGIEPTYDPRTDIPAGVRPLKQKYIIIVKITWTALTKKSGDPGLFT